MQQHFSSFPKPGNPAQLSFTTWSRHQIARLLGAAGFALLAQFAVDMPQGYFGPAESMTPFGWTYATAVLALLALASLGYNRRRRWAAFAGGCFLVLNIGVFVPVLVVDPVVSSVIVLWNLMLLSLIILAAPPSIREVALLEDQAEVDPARIYLARNGRAMLHLTTVALLMNLLVLGYGIGARIPALILCGSFDLLTIGAALPYLVIQLKRQRRRWFFAASFLLISLATIKHPVISLASVSVFLGILWITLLSHTQTFSDLLQHFYQRPAVLVLGSFALLIIVGTLALSLPAASPGAASIRAVDALFTATSASCVTGLIVLDTPTDFSTSGQIVILLLIQAGGLSIMVLSTFAALILRRDIGWQGEHVIAELLDLQSPGSALHLTVFVVAATFVIEAVGAAVLSFGFHQHGLAWLDAIWRGSFHAVSAFCNAGFSLQSDSLALFRESPLMLMTFAVLIVLGGLGFVVLADGWYRIMGRHPMGFNFHSKIVLVATGSLLALGTICMLALDWNRSLAGMPLGDRLANAFFQSVTLRTAGFNSIDMTLVHPALLFLFMAFMFVGASPGGTGGGVKTTTAAVLFGAIPALARRKPAIVFFGRTVSLESFYRSAAITAIALGIIILGGVLILATQGQSFEALLFELFSAFGTVGLSLGATAQLDSFGKIVILLIMFAGRVGPLTLAILLGRSSAANIEYPEVKIMVG